MITISDSGVEYNEISSNIKILFFTKVMKISKNIADQRRVFDGNMIRGRQGKGEIATLLRTSIDFILPP